MWGNRLGWGIGGVIAILLGAILGWLISLSRISAPSGIGKDPANLAVIALPIAPDQVWPLASDDFDAGNQYSAIMKSWTDADDQTCGAYVANPNLPAPRPLQMLIEVRHDKRMQLFNTHLAELINYDSEHPSLDHLFQAGEWACKAGLSLHQHDKPKEARQMLEGAFALGRHLYEERIDFSEYSDGVSLMADAATTMQDVVTKGSTFYDALTEFNQDRIDYENNHVFPIWQVLSSIDDSVVDTTAGDVAVFAEQSPEHLWRIEATLKLGRYRYNAGSIGDQIGAIQLLGKLADDPNPAVALAARTAHDLTLDAYRKID